MAGTYPPTWSQCKCAALIADKQHLKSDAIFTNEGIVATAVYCVESTNVKPPSIAFRMRTSPDQPDLRDLILRGPGELLPELRKHLAGAGTPCCVSYKIVRLVNGPVQVSELTQSPVSIATPKSLSKTRQSPGDGVSSPSGWSIPPSASSPQPTSPRSSFTGGPVLCLTEVYRGVPAEKCPPSYWKSSSAN